MRKLILILMIACTCLFLLNDEQVSAADWNSSQNSLPHTTPWIDGGVTYTYAAMYNVPPFTGVIEAVYCPDSVYLKADYNYNALALRSSTSGCRFFGSTNFGTTWTSYSWAFSYFRKSMWQIPVNTMLLSDVMRSQRYIRATYNENWYGAFGFNSVSIGQQLLAGTNFGQTMYALTVSPEPVTGGGVASSDQAIQCGVNGYNYCQANFALNSNVQLQAYPSEGYEFDHWVDGANQYTDNPHTFNMGSSAKTVTAVFMNIIPIQATITEQVFSVNRIKRYSFTLTETTSIALLSGGTLDVKGRVLDSDGYAVLDENYNEYCHGYTDIGTINQGEHAQINFMYRKQDLVAGTYTLEVTPEDAQESIVGTFSIVFLKKPTNSDEFFAGMDALLDDDDETNDYLDIYVKALYPEFYEDLDDIDSSNYGGSIPYGTVKRERQCKALVNFYLRTVLGRGTGTDGFMFGDDLIQSNWSYGFADSDSNCIAEDDNIIQAGQSSLVYHSLYLGQFGPTRCGTEKYFYNPNTNQTTRSNSGDLASFITKGDVFVQYVIDPEDGNYNHYGLIINGTTVLDSNVCASGRICKAGPNEGGFRNTDHWKVTRPQ